MVSDASLSQGLDKSSAEQSRKKEMLAQDVEIPMRLPTPILMPQDLGLTGESVKHIFQVAKDLEHSIKHPFRAHIGEALKEIQDSKWSDAYSAFPQFKEAQLSEKQVTELMQGIVRNELFFYDFADAQDDKLIRETGRPMELPIGPQRKAEDATLGYSQVSIAGVEKFEKEQPTQMAQYAGREKDALLNPTQAPMMVAAVLCHNLEMYKRHNIPITEKNVSLRI